MIDDKKTKVTLFNATKLLVNTAAIIPIIKYDPDINPSRSTIEARLAIKNMNSPHIKSELTEDDKKKISQDAANKIADALFLTRTTYHVDAKSYINELTDTLQKDKRIVLPEEKPEQLFQRLLATYDYLVSLKFTQIIVIETYLYAQAYDPSFKNNPIVKGWIEKIGQPAQQQFEDMIYLARKFDFFKNYITD